MTKQLCFVWVVLFCRLINYWFKFMKYVLWKQTNFYEVVFTITKFSLPATSCFEEVHEILSSNIFADMQLLRLSRAGCFVLQVKTHTRTHSFTYSQHCSHLAAIAQSGNSYVRIYHWENCYVCFSGFTHNGLYLCENACGTKMLALVWIHRLHLEFQLSDCCFRYLDHSENFVTRMHACTLTRTQNLLSIAVTYLKLAYNVHCEADVWPKIKVERFHCID